MKTILSILTLLIVGIIIYYLIKRRRENFEIKGDTQPDVDQEIYDYNLEQALKIWDDIVGPNSNGTYKPTAKNRRLWAHENWREELKAYVKEAEKFNSEHNWFDYEPGRGETLMIKRRDTTKEKVSPIGIREAWKRINGDDLGKYKFPKPGDRVRILKDDNKKKNETPYYTGIVLGAFGSGNSKRARVLWDRRNNPSGGKDINRWKTKGLRSHITNPLVLITGKIFGWPQWNWKRHYSDNKASDYVNPYLSWTSYKDLGKGKHIFDAKYLYKVVECKNAGTTGCDFLRCDKRKETALTNYPITYHCARDPRNRHPGIWKCDSGRKKGTFYNYYDKSSMCREDYRRGKKDTFCLQNCSGRCVPTTLEREINKAKRSTNSKCTYLVSDHPTKIEDGNYVFLDGDKGIFGSNKISIRYGDKIATRWRKYANEWQGRRAPRPGITYKTKKEYYYVGNWWERLWKKKRRSRTVRLVMIRYGDKGKFVNAWIKQGKWHKCAHLGWHRAFSWDPIWFHRKRCEYLDKRKTTIPVPRQNWDRNYSTPLKFLNNKTIKSMKVIGRGCKFASKSKYYGEGFHRNLNLKNGKTTCAMGRRAVLYDGCNYHYQNRADCLRECGRGCVPKLINLRRHGCKYSRGQYIGGKRLIPAY